MTDKTLHTPLWRKILKVAAWTIMAIILAVIATGICAISLLDPPHLTPLAERVANRMLDAEVRLGRAEITLAGHFPFLRLDVDSVTVLSGPMRRLHGDQRRGLPQWADTLLTLERFSGGINLMALAHNKIDLHDVTFTRPGINIATLNDSVSNYLIYTSTDTTGTSSGSMPKISINRFAVERPRPIRYHNAHTDEHFEVYLNSINLEGSQAPTYSLSMGGHVESPSLGLYNLEQLQFGLDGHMGWDPEKPTELELRQFRLHADFLDALVDAHVDFDRDIVVRDYSLDLGRMGIERITHLLPDSLKTVYGLTPDKFDTDLTVSFMARSTGPFNLTTDSLPHADITLEISPGSLRYGHSHFRNVSGRLGASLRGNTLDSAIFTASDLNIAGPATDLTVNGSVTMITSDPIIKATLKGSTELLRLPEQLTRLFGGYLSGRITADIALEGRPSMFSRNGFHRLRVTGDIDADDIYYLSADTANMVDLQHACFRFGTNSRVKTTGGMADSLLTASISVDTANVLSSNISMRFSDVKLGVGASNRRRSADTTVIVPMGGRLEVGAFYLTSISDTTVFNLRDAGGTVRMTRFEGESRRPQFDFELDVRRMAAGNKSSRFMLRGSHVRLHAHKLPPREMPRHIKATADSLHQIYPYLPMDSVYRYAVRKHRHHPGQRPRVHPQYTDAETEIIDWGTSKALRRLLLRWSLDGEVTADRAGLFTPYFPIRNRVRDFNIRFNNDTIYMQNVRYKAGHSDFLLSGRISNLKRGFTSRGYRSPLKINFDIVSDTIDVNELASSTFRGAAYAAADTMGHHAAHKMNLDEIEHAEDISDEKFEKEIGRYVAGAPDSVAPLLIPRNIDLRLDLRADNVLYSDLTFHDFTGELLAYEGAVNLHHLTARSDVGDLNMSALYSAPSARDLKFGFGLQVNDFKIDRFTRLVPAIDSIMPLLHDVSGMINADIAATCDIDNRMNLLLPTLTAAIKLEGDSLALIDKETYRTIGKWLLFKDKQSNIIDHMNVEVIVRDNEMQLYPFEFFIDRYKLGVQGYNDLALNFNYHIAVLKSPIPFKFGINISGNPDKYKIRLGKARFNTNQAARTVSIVDTARVNLLRQIENIFRRGVSGSRFANIDISHTPTAASIDINADTISHADSLLFIQEGLIPAPVVPDNGDTPGKDKKKKAPKAKRIKTKTAGHRP
ncbi:MAG: hypothetical protein Q4C34_02330 [Bacteroidales bacterium]|nr:hypothetical protein [Bacteroidales bacterium]